ncbi:MAG: hypothetical protein L0Y68_03610 [Candidatus Dadabacteria bacterium]|nr:hypothetical protein [Candidatus Dadabacteria bacterium]
MYKKSAIVDLDMKIDEGLRQPIRSFLHALECIEMLYHMQKAGEASIIELEDGIYQKMVETLKRGASYLSGQEKLDLSSKVESMRQGIYDICSITLRRKEEDYIDLILGKIHSWDKHNSRCYSGAVGVINKSFDNLIEGYDKKLDLFLENLPVSEEKRGFSIKKSAPVMRCIEVFFLAGELNIRHKPICVFFSGGTPQNLSTLSRMTVFINIYATRFKLISKEIARKYLEDYSVIEGLDESITSKLLLVWLRGHDLGHFYGVDSINKKMSELDKSYLILHELKSDLIALYNLRYLTEDFLKDDLLIKAYVVAIAEMFRYIRRGMFYNYPDTASAFLAYSFFKESGSINFDAKAKKFKIDFEKLEVDIKNLTSILLNLFAEGDVREAMKLVNRFGDIKELGQYGFPGELEVLSDTEIPHYIDFNFVTRDRLL